MQNYDLESTFLDLAQGSRLFFKQLNEKFLVISSKECLIQHCSPNPDEPFHIRRFSKHFLHNPDIDDWKISEAWQIVRSCTLEDGEHRFLVELNPQLFHYACYEAASKVNALHRDSFEKKFDPAMYPSVVLAALELLAHITDSTDVLSRDMSTENTDRINWIISYDALMYSWSVYSRFPINESFAEGLRARLKSSDSYLGMFERKIKHAEDPMGGLELEDP